MKTFLQKIFNPALKLTEDEQKVKQVIELMLANPETKYAIAPLTSSILLEQKETGYYVLIEGAVIKICNHQFALHSQYRLNFVEQLKEIIYAKVEADRQEAITEIFNNQQKLLDEIINNLTL